MTHTIKTIAASLVIAATAAADEGTIEGTVSGLGKGPFVVYVEQIPGATYPPMKPAPQLHQKNYVYLPRILPIVVGTTIEIHSSDPELHNVYAWATALKRTLFNIAILPGAPPQHQTFTKEGVVRVTCSIHKDMLSFILVLQNPHFTLTGPKGEFRLSGVPVGKHRLRVWGEKLGEPQLAKAFPAEVLAGQAAKLTIQ